MRTIIKFILIALAILIGLIVIGISYIHFSGIPSFENKARDIKIEVDSARIAEGARIASMACNQCHRSKDNKLGGAYLADVKVFGKIYAPNITQHKDYGIVDYTDGELVYLLRTGIKRDGQYIPPYMPKFPHLSDEDIENIVAFLRSDDPIVQPSDENPPKSKPSLLTKFLCKVAFSPLPYPEESIPPPDTNDIVAFGKYISTAKFDCYSCHSNDFKTVDIMVPEKSEGYFGGGNKLLDLDGNLVLSSNLTMDKETGIGAWTEEEFITAVKTGKRPNRTPMSYPMTPFSALTDKEASAIWAYLNTLPMINNPNNKIK